MEIENKQEQNEICRYCKWFDKIERGVAYCKLKWKLAYIPTRCKHYLDKDSEGIQVIG